MSNISEDSSRHGESLRGDLVTGIVDITNERAHAVPPIRNEDSDGKKQGNGSRLFTHGEPRANPTHPFPLSADAVN